MAATKSITGRRSGPAGRVPLAEARPWPRRRLARRSREPRPRMPGRRCRGRAPTPRAAEVAEELRIRGQHHRGAARVERRGIGDHRAVELEELGIALEGAGEDRVALGLRPRRAGFPIPCAPPPPSRRPRGRRGRGCAAPPSRPRARSRSASARRSAFMRSKVCCETSCVRSVRRMRTSSICQPERGCVRPKLVAHLAHHRRTLFRQGRLEAAQAVDPAQRRVETGPEPLLGELHLAGHGRAEAPRIGDAVGDEGIDLVELAARRPATRMSSRSKRRMRSSTSCTLSASKKGRTAP